MTYFRVLCLESLKKNIGIGPYEKLVFFCLEFPDGYCCYLVDRVYECEVSCLLISCVKCPFVLCKTIQNAFGTCTLISAVKWPCLRRVTFTPTPPSLFRRDIFSF